jgi:Protein of unknown function (DUF2958)
MFKPCETLLDHPEVLADLPPLYSTVGKGKPILRIRFYHPLSRWNWYGVEYDPQERIFFGWVEGFEPEWGYFSLNEMAFMELKGVPIMWDTDFKPIHLKDMPQPPT